MAKQSKETSYWPHMILGFLVIGLTLSYWTVKSASSVPVQESNAYLLKYQQADMNINEIMKAKESFDKQYRIALVNVKKRERPLLNAKRAKEVEVVVLHKGKNSFDYRITNLKGEPLSLAKVTFLLTRPHTVREDRVIENIPFEGGLYRVKDVDITKAGRYLLRLKVEVGDEIGYSEVPAYLDPA